MLGDEERARRLTGLDDAAAHRRRLPAVIARIEQLDAHADAAWLKQQHGLLNSLRAALFVAYDEVGLQPRVYERLVEQSEKPLLEQAKRACVLPTGAWERRRLERLVRMPIDEYIELEKQIADLIGRMGADRDAFAEAHRELADAYVRSLGHEDDVALAAGFLGLRLAANRFDERRGYSFMTFAVHWIDLQLDRAGCKREP